MKIKKAFAAFALSVTIASCGRDGTFSADFAQQTQDFAELREQLNVRIQSTATTGTLPLNCTAQAGCTPEGFYAFVQDSYCATQAGWTSHCAFPTSVNMTGNLCGAEVCDAELQLCVAQTLLEITQLAAPQVYPRSGATTLTIPPQSAATNSELARLAYRASRVAFDRAAVSLGATANSPQTGLATQTKCTGASVSATDINLAATSVPGTNTTISRAELFIGVLGESVLVAREAAASTTRFSQSVSDARLSSESEEERARAYALNLPFASRGSAAHTLVGGEMGLRVFDGSSLPSATADTFVNPLFAAERLSPDGAQALEYLRMAGPAPSVILSTWSIDTLFTTPTDNLRSRLSAILGDPDLATQTPAGVYTRLGLSQRAFVEARNYLAAELRAFGRDNTLVTLPAEPLPRVAGTASPTTTTWPIYAATRTRPNRPLRTWWNAVLRYQSVAPTTTGQLAFQPITTLTTTIPAFSVPAAGYGDIVDPSPTTADPAIVPTSVAAFLDGATTALRRATISPTWSGTTVINAANQAALRPRLDEILSDLEASVDGRLRVCWQQQTPTFTGEHRIRVSLWGEEGTNSLLMVRGREGLECAVRGRIDGTTCTLSGASGTVVPIFDSAGTSTIATFGPTYVWSSSSGTLATEVAAHGYSRQLDATFQISATGNPYRSTASGAPIPPDVYVVRLRAGRTGLPGDWEEFAGVRLPAPCMPPGGGSCTAPTSSTLRYCLTGPIVPDIEAFAVDAVELNPGDPTSNAMSCAGVPFDQRIPLENELTSNGDDIESSWRHYLEMAEQAATRADMLGEELIRNGLDNDMRSERAIDSLENICGVPINLSSVGAISTRTASAVPRNVARSGGACPAGYSDQGGSLQPCVLDPVAYAAIQAASDEDAAQLSSCLGAGTPVLATLANVPVCVWTNGGDVRTVCENSNADFPCPFEAQTPTMTATCDSTRVRPGFGYTATLVTNPLGFFGIPEPRRNPSEHPPEETDDSNPCVALANLRESETPRHRAAVDAARGSMFSSAALSSISSRIGFRAGAGDVARVTFDGTTILRTGYSDGRTVGSPEWPCAALPAGSYGPDKICPSTTAGSATTNFAGPSINCLRIDCSQPDQRARANDMLARAVIAARLLGGASLSGLELPWYPRAGDDALWLSDPQGWTAPVGSPNYQESSSGALRIWNTGGGDWDSYNGDFGELHAVAQRVDGPEWRLFNALTGTVAEIFDNSVDADDATCVSDSPPGSTAAIRRSCERNMPLFVRRLPDGLEGDDPNTASAAWWSTGFWGGTSVNDIIANPRSVPTALALDARSGAFLDDGFPARRLTHYWVRSGCGTIGGSRCNGFEGRDSGEEDQALAATQNCVANASSGYCASIGCNTRYMSCNQQADAIGVDFQFTFDGNRAFIAPQGLTRSDVLNGLELLCSASRATVADPTTFGCDGAPPVIDSISDMLKAEDYLRCRSDNVRRRIGMTVLSDIPPDVIRRLRSNGAMSVGGSAGAYDEQVSLIAAALYDMQAAQSTILGNTDEVANAIRTLRNAIGQSRLAGQIEDLELASTVANNITQCVVASLTAVSRAANSGAMAAATAGVEGASAAATCNNNIFQTVIATQVHDLRRQGLEIQTEQAFVDFEHRYQIAATNLTQQAGAMQSALQRLDAALAAIRSLQQQGRRAVAQALFLDSDTSGRTFGVNTASRRRYNTSVARYERARLDAIRAAYVARRALEQRLGMDLRDIRQDLTLVSAPSGWSESLCSMPAIDYDRIRATTPGVTGDRASDPGAFDGPAGYAGLFVGDYVVRLRQVFESYSFAYPFQDGRDTAVLSLRDDVMGIRADCPVDTPNWLYWSGSFDHFESADGPGWRTEGCAISPTWPYPTTPLTSGMPPLSPVPPPSCIRAVPVGVESLTGAYRTAAAMAEDESREAPTRETSADFGRPSGYRLEFGVTTPVDLPSDNFAYEAVSPSTRLVQWVDLPAGRYRLSWYGRSVVGETVSPATAVQVRSARRAAVDGTYTDEQVVTTSPLTTLAADTNGWQRFSVQFDAPGGRSVGIVVNPGFIGTLPAGRRVLELGAFMVEQVPGAAATSSLAATTSGRPSPYFDTTDVRERTLRVCEDTHGDVFRPTAWMYRCTQVCPDGYDGNCDPRYAQQRCFWETSFSASADRLQRLATSTASGFAAGNYNYRIEGIGLNFVGTGLRDCEVVGGPTPSTCYATGNIRYSVLHAGPYLVRNATGALYSSPIFPGRIESARGVAAERYFSNPISGADQALMQPYIRNELRGRPLGGSITIRVWDEPGLVFDNIEDVQLILNYRYWTHQR